MSGSYPFINSANCVITFLSSSPSHKNTSLSPVEVTIPIATTGYFSPNGKLPSGLCVSISNAILFNGASLGKSKKNSGCSIQSLSSRCSLPPSNKALGAMISLLGT